MSTKKKLIEVALPLEAINKEAAREKSIRHGHPSTLHVWWARRPLAACRAVIFASLVDDPSSDPERFPDQHTQDAERQRLFRIIEELVRWENITNARVLKLATEEVKKHTKGNPPAFLDPFCGGGSIPLEAQRLGLSVTARDLNPVPVLMTKALVEIPSRFSGRPPVNPTEVSKGIQHKWKAAHGLAADVRHYGLWMRDEAFRRVGKMYPTIKLPKSHGGSVELPIAWIFARSVKCPNPACNAVMPLSHTFWLSKKRGSRAWIKPIVQREDKNVRFEVQTTGEPPEGTVNRRGAICISCSAPVPFDYIRSEGRAGRLSAQLMSIVVDTKGGRIYLSPTKEQEDAASSVTPPDLGATSLPEAALGFRVQLYGMTTHQDLFSPRQLLALGSFCDLVAEAHARITKDAVEAGWSKSGKPLHEGGEGARAYADAVASYLGLTASKAARFSTTLSFWRADEGKLSRAFGRQTVSMTWDFAETNPFASAGGDFGGLIEGTAEALERVPAEPIAKVEQASATASMGSEKDILISTDPPYYDNVPYADLSDIFYIWLRRALKGVHPNLFGTLLTPKAEELIAEPARFNNDSNAARSFFERGLGAAFSSMRAVHSTEYPMTVYYGFKQSESEDEEPGEAAAVASTGWETMLEGLLQAGFQITGTWPMRTEGPTRMRGIGSNALASSIVLVCRSRPPSAPIATRREFINVLDQELPAALNALKQGNVAPVDLEQAAIGPGIGIFSRYSKIVEADGNPMSVRTALQIINKELDAYLASQDSDYDADTRFCISWFEQYGMKEGPFGEADGYARAKNTSVEGVAEGGVLLARSGVSVQGVALSLVADCRLLESFFAGSS